MNIINLLVKMLLLEPFKNCFLIIRADYLELLEASIRAQACDRQGNLLDDFNIRKNGNIIHVCNAPSPGATASLSINKNILNKVLCLLN